MTASGPGSTGAFVYSEAAVRGGVTTDSSQTTTSVMIAGTPYQKLLIGSVLAIGGNLLISISLNLQKYTHLQTAKDTSGKHYLTRPIWWLGLFLMGFGEIGNFSAYGFAPASLVAPLGTTTVIANTFIAVIFLKEILRPEDIFGCALAIVGAFLLVTFASKGEQVLDANEIMQLLKGTGFIVYVIFELVMLLILFLIKYRYKIDNVLVLLLITALMASFTVISAKAVSGMLQLTIADQMQLQHPIFWVLLVIMVVTAVVQVKFLNQAMKLYDSTTVVPTNFVFFTISAITAGAVFYLEFSGMSLLDILMFLFGCLLCFFGVYFITAGRSPASETDKDASKNEAERDLYASICPTWLFSTMSNAEAEPHTDNQTPDDLTPIIQKDDTLSSSTVPPTAPEDESGDGHGQPNSSASYGSTTPR